ncbi:MAG: hypothetical protein AB7S93_20800 [Xanthobacteraceae bacterium]
MLDCLDRPGIWRRAGMAGHVIGLDMREALAAIPTGLDVGVVKRLLMIAERHFVAAWLARAMEQKPD